MIKAVFFDVGGVLIYDRFIPVQERLARLLQLRDVTDPRAQFRHEWSMFLEGKISEVGFCLRICKRFRRPCPSRKVLASLFRRQIKRAVTGSLRIVRRLRMNGYRTGVISNTSRVLEEERKKLFPYALFDVVILSHKVHVRKPKKRIFQIARQKVGVRFPEMAFVDDSPEVVKAAKKLGIKAFVYKNPTQLVRQLRRFGVKI